MVEPWAREYPLDVGQEVLLVFQGDSDPDIEVEHRDDSIVVYAWEGSTYRALSNDVEL